ncbi:hypothetical protein EIP91_010122 [Steccherinum ochraceum]|uniref:Uncharacterized protein n=1 Tax=Steccherinum ochraceum TaxID=92696 RepID=A0A4R0RTX0_9APHY|nr:hypothetical protein EIP91_010122 [Steccherinum ochraceum]
MSRRRIHNSIDEQVYREQLMEQQPSSVIFTLTPRKYENCDIQTRIWKRIPLTGDGIEDPPPQSVFDLSSRLSHIVAKRSFTDMQGQQQSRLIIDDEIRSGQSLNVYDALQTTSSNVDCNIEESSLRDRHIAGGPESEITVNNQTRSDVDLSISLDSQEELKRLFNASQEVQSAPLTPGLRYVHITQQIRLMKLVRRSTWQLNDGSDSKPFAESAPLRNLPGLCPVKARKGQTQELGDWCELVEDLDAITSFNIFLSDNLKDVCIERSHLDDLVKPTGSFTTPKMVSAVNETARFMKALSKKFLEHPVHNDIAFLRELKAVDDMDSALKAIFSELNTSISTFSPFEHLAESMEAALLVAHNNFTRLPPMPDRRTYHLRCLLDDVAAGVHTVLMHITYRRMEHMKRAAHATHAPADELETLRLIDRLVSRMEALEEAVRSHREDYLRLNDWSARTQTQMYMVLPGLESTQQSNFATTLAAIEDVATGVETMRQRHTDINTAIRDLSQERRLHVQTDPVTYREDKWANKRSSIIFTLSPQSHDCRELSQLIWKTIPLTGAGVEPPSQTVLDFSPYITKVSPVLRNAAHIYSSVQRDAARVLPQQSAMLQKNNLGRYSWRVDPDPRHEESSMIKVSSAIWDDVRLCLDVPYYNPQASEPIDPAEMTKSIITFKRPDPNQELSFSSKVVLRAYYSTNAGHIEATRISKDTWADLHPLKDPKTGHDWSRVVADLPAISSLRICPQIDFKSIIVEEIHLEDLVLPTGNFHYTKLETATTDLVRRLERLSNKLSSIAVPPAVQQPILAAIERMMNAVQDIQKEAQRDEFEEKPYDQLDEKLESNLVDAAKFLAPLEQPGGDGLFLRFLLEDVSAKVHEVLMHITYRRFVVKPDSASSSTSPLSPVLASLSPRYTQPPPAPVPSFALDSVRQEMLHLERRIQAVEMRRPEDKAKPDTSAVEVNKKLADHIIQYHKDRAETEKTVRYNVDQHLRSMSDRVSAVESKQTALQQWMSDMEDKTKLLARDLYDYVTRMAKQYNPVRGA